MHISSIRRVRIATAAATAGISLVTVMPAVADDTAPERWTATDASSTGLSWTVTDLTGPRRRPAVSRESGVRRTPSTLRRRAKVAGRARYPWRASTVCRVRQGRTWFVGPGDTLSLISACHPGVTVDQLRDRNGLRGDTIRVGQLLHIPAVTR
ncbi:MAG: LysM domain [Actinomycetota bacterium]|nr:LysM domain [Actinomycetota bacterium]